MTRGRVIHTGEALVDIVLRVSHLPRRGGDVFADYYSFSVGGAFNSMAAAARDGAEVIWPGAQGDGEFGNRVRTAMAEEGIRVLAEASPGQDTGFSVAMVEPDAERTFVSTVGAEGTPDARVFDGLEVASGDVVYVSGYSFAVLGPRDVIVPWLARVPSESLVVFDPGPLVDELTDELLATVRTGNSIWSMNEQEARVLLERFPVARRRPAGSGSDADPRVAAAERLAESLGITVVLRLGAAGAIVAWPETSAAEAPVPEVNQPVVIPAPLVEAVDTNGAGDAHCGVLCSALARGEDLLRAVKRANHAAATAVTRHGPATSPTASEIERSLQADQQGS